MLSTASGAVRIAARRIAPSSLDRRRADTEDLLSLGRSTNIAQAPLSSARRLSYAVNTNPNSALGQEECLQRHAVPNWPHWSPRLYRRKSLIDLIHEHPNMDLRHVSSRELVGQELKGYTKRKIIYENLSPGEVAQLDRDGEGRLLGRGSSQRRLRAFCASSWSSSSLIVDLSADHRFRRHLDVRTSRVDSEKQDRPIEAHQQPWVLRDRGATGLGADCGTCGSYSGLRGFGLQRSWYKAFP